MKLNLRIIPLALAAFGLVADSAFADFAVQWQAGQPGRGWPQGNTTGGPNVNFVQEAGTNPPPGDPNSPAVNQQADDDYYFAGTYPSPIGTVANDEIAFERAYAGTDNDLRIHFNLPAVGMDANSLARFSYEPENFHVDATINPDPRYGTEVYFNGVLVMPEVVNRPADVHQIFTTDPFTLGSVNAMFGPGGDNVVYLKGINYNADGGGNWMGIDYHALEVDAEGGAPIPTLSEWGLIIFSLLLLTVGVIRIRAMPSMMTASTGGASMMMSGSKKPLFVPQMFAKCFTVTLIVAAVGLGVAVWVMGTVPVRDIVGTLISATIVAYLAHTFLPSQESKQ